MDIKEYSKLIKAKRKELDDLMKRKMPVIAGRMAKDHFQDNFRREGFVNGGLHPWPKAKRLSSGRTDAAGQRTAFSLSATGVAESEKAVLRADRCGRTVRDITLRKEPPLQLRQVRAGGLPRESGRRPHVRTPPQLGRRSASDRYAANAALCMGEVLPSFRQG